MIESLKREAAIHGDKAAIVPIHRLQEIREDIKALQDGGSLNQFQQYITHSIYNFDLPDAGFEVRSIIIVASPSPAVVDLLFAWRGKTIPVKLPASYIEKNEKPRRIEKYLKALLNPRGYDALYAPQLPHKRLAVRSGLAEYGRNNICYVEGMGSFLNLEPYFSDLPCPQSAWVETRQMDLCRACQACLKNCPTGAILPSRFLIDNERCLTYFNEAGPEWNFPAWIDPSDHHTVYGCMRCQAVCPADRPYLNRVLSPVQFNEEETRLLLEGASFDLFPDGLKQKITEFEMADYLGALPRNLRAVFAQSGLT